MLKDRLKRLLHFAPVGAAWQGAKAAYAFGHKGLTASKALAYYIAWSATQKREEYAELESDGVERIRPFRPLRWKHEVCYFTGEVDGRPVFVKTGGKVNTTNRERTALASACERSSILRQHIPSLRPSPSNDFTIEALVSGRSLDHLGRARKGLPLSCTPLEDSLVRQLYAIYCELRDHNIMHLDIRPENFILDETNNLVLIDFGYALVDTDYAYDKIAESATAKRIIKDLGSVYAPKNGTLDDAYSMLMTMKYVCPSLLQKHPNIWLRMNEDIGQRVVKL